MVCTEITIWCELEVTVVLKLWSVYTDLKLMYGLIKNGLYEVNYGVWVIGCESWGVMYGLIHELLYELIYKIDV